MSFYPTGIESNGGDAGGMMGAIGGVLGGPVGAIAGSVASGLFSGRQARKQMQFQERMASTQYQRAAKDLEAAGLNRVLALGSPAAAPGGAMASMPDLGSSMSSGSQASTAAKAQKSTASLQAAGVNSAMAAAEQTRAQTKLLESLAPAQIAKASSEAVSAAKNAERDAMINKALETIAPGVDSVLKLLGEGITSAKGAIDSIPKALEGLFGGGDASAKSSVWRLNGAETNDPVGFMIDQIMRSLGRGSRNPVKKLKPDPEYIKGEGRGKYRDN